MRKSGLISRLNGMYSALRAGALIGSLYGCGDGPLPPKPNNKPSLEFSVSPTSGVSPLEVRIQGRCTDADGNSDIRSYKIIKDGTVISTKNPTDTTLTLTENSSYSSECEDKMEKVTAGPISISVTEPPVEKDAIAYSAILNGNEDIFSSYIDGSEIKKLTTNSGQDIRPAWSPDGRQIVLQTNRDGVFSIYIMNADGVNQRRLFSTPFRTLNPSWSPDGKKIAFTYSDFSTVSGIGSVNSDGTEFISIYEEPFSSQLPRSPVFSPDGKKMAFENHFIEKNYEIYEIDILTKTKKNLTNNPASDQQPKYFPDNTYMAFVSDREGGHIYRLNKDNGELIKIVDGIDPEISPDGKKILFARSNQSSLYLINSEGIGNIETIPLQGLVRFPAWKPNK